MKLIFFKRRFVDEILKLVLGGVAILFMGCSTLQIPAGTNISPEISSKFVELGVDSTQTRNLYLTESEDVGNSQITTKGGGTFRGGSVPSMYAALNVSDFFSLISETGGYKLQFQILGDSRQKAKPGNVSVSVFGGQGTTKVSQYPVELANPAKYLISTGASDIPSITVNTQIFGGIIGYRSSEKVVVALLYYKQKFSINAKGTIEDKSSGSTVNRAGVEINNEFIDTGIGIPIFLGGETFAFQFTPTYVTMIEPIMKKETSYILSNLKMTWTFP